MITEEEFVAGRNSLHTAVVPPQPLPQAAWMTLISWRLYTEKLIKTKVTNIEEEELTIYISI